MPRGITALTKQRQEAIYHWAELHHPVTVRQLYYRLSTIDLCPKDDKGYKAIQRVGANMRKEGILPWAWITDSSRWQRKPESYGGLEEALSEMQRYYRRNVWLAQERYIEVWLEKDALAGIFYPITAEWDVPLMVSKGFSSLTYVYDAAQTFKAQALRGKDCHIYYFGDYDPSGKDIGRDIRAKLLDYAPEAEVSFHEVAVLPSQIDRWSLPSRPTKKKDSRAKGWKGDSVEMDSIDPKILRRLVTHSIVACVDPDVLAREKKIEELESETLSQYVSAFL